MKITGRLAPFSALLVIFSGFIAVGEPIVCQNPGVDSQSETRVVISLSGKKSATVPPLAKSSLLVTDNGKRVPIDDLHSVKDEAFTFSLLVDASATISKITASQIAGAIKLFAALSQKGNRGYLILFRDGLATNDLLLDASSAEQILKHEDSRAQSTAIYDAISHAVKIQLSSPGQTRPDRRAIFLMTDGGDNASHVSLPDTIAMLQREGVTVFCIDTPTDAKEAEKARELHTLRALSHETGGEMVTLDDRGSFVSQLLDVIENQYIVSFSATPEKHQGLHSLEVKSASKDIKISAPTHFLAP